MISEVSAQVFYVFVCFAVLVYIALRARSVLNVRWTRLTAIIAALMCFFVVMVALCALVNSEAGTDRAWHSVVYSVILHYGLACFACSMLGGLLALILAAQAQPSGGRVARLLHSWLHRGTVGVN